MKKFRKLLLLMLMCCAAFNNVLHAQHITNTLGTSGLFKIKDNVNTYFTLTQSNGYIELTKSLKLQETSDLNTGVIYKGSIRFIHNYEKSGSSGNNTFVGINAGNFTLGGASFIDGSSNTALGYFALNKLTTGYGNTAVGTNSLSLNTSGYYNIAIGNSSLSGNTSGTYLVAIGPEALVSNTTGANNVAIGFLSISSNTTGLNNIGIGNSSLSSNTIGWDNIAIGKQTLDNNIDGNKNTGIGNISLGNCTGDNNTALGYSSASSLTTGSNTTVIGYNAQPSSATVSNQITLGNNSVSSLRCNVQTITSLSDARDKKNINSLSLGLDFLMQLKPRQFNWDRREWYDNQIPDGSLMDIDPTAGFIAQELDSVQNEFNAPWLKLVLKDNPDKWEATYGNLLPVVVKAVQELKSENDRLKQENETLALEVRKLKDIEQRVAMLEGIFNNEESKEVNNAGR